MGTLCDTPSPESMPVVSPERYRTVLLAMFVAGGRVERLDRGVRHALSVILGVQSNFLEQNGILFRRNPEFVVERVMQDFLHVVPIRDDTNDAQYLYPALVWRPP